MRSKIPTSCSLPAPRKSTLYSSIALLVWLLPAVSLAHGAVKQRVIREIQIAAPAEEVWALISDFCAIETWHPAVYSCAASGGNEPGAVRLLTLGSESGPQLQEALQRYDADKRSYTYTIIKTDMTVLPVTKYSGVITVKDNGGTSTVKWLGGFYRGYPKDDPPPELNDEAAVKAIVSVYDAGLASIKKIAER